jgi:uncharacterized membrane protein
VERLLTFSDAVVAIAATLLVLPLVDIAPKEQVEDVGALLADNLNNFLAFLLSFVVIYRFWLTHHHTFGAAKQLGGALIWLNGLWLISIVFLPFPTQLIGDQDVHNRLVNGLYIGTMLVTAASAVAGQWLVARADARAGRPSTIDPYGPGLALVVALAVALVIALAFPAIGLWSLLVLVVSGVLAARMRRRARTASTRGQATPPQQ